MANKLNRVALETNGQSGIWQLWASDMDSVTVGLMAGVMQVSDAPAGAFNVFVDPRYDLGELKAEILALNNTTE